MQEEVENRTVNLAISTTKLTGRTIIAGIRKYLQHREKVKMKKARDPAVHGKQSVKQLFDKRNEFCIEQFLSRRLKLKAGDEFVVVDAD